MPPVRALCQGALVLTGGVQDAPAFADVHWSREAALKAPAASVSGVKSWRVLLGREGGEWFEVQQPGRVERGTVGQEEGEQQEKRGAFQEILLLFGE